MKKVCIQAGHKGITSGATGAPGERDWTSTIVPMISKILKSKGVEVYETDAKGNLDSVVTKTDWDYFLAVHYDADIYNDRGGFVDYPDESVDDSFHRSKQLALALSEHYFKATGIPERPQRSNPNTKFYYMWNALSRNTPCVIIECGVGNRKPEDYNVLRKYEFVADAIADGILEGLGLPTGHEEENLQKKLDETIDELIEMRASRDKWKRMYSELEQKCIKDTQSSDEHIKNLQSTVAEQSAQIMEMNKTILSLTSENKRLTSQSRALEQNVVDMTTNLRTETARADKFEKKYNDLRKAGKKWYEFWVRG